MASAATSTASYETRHDLEELILLDVIRRTETETVVEILRERGAIRVLEIGSGSGLQAMELSRFGFDVVAIDVKPEKILPHDPYLVRQFNGIELPFPSESFDAIFSSNVLEHVRNPEALYAEMLRVLKSDDGFAVHVLPSVSWKAYTFLTHYPDAIIRSWNRMFYSSSPTSQAKTQAEKTELSFSRKLLRLLYPELHGEKGNALTETFHFRQNRWVKELDNNGWKVVDRRAGQIAYSGNLLFGQKLSLNFRGWIAGLFGASVNFFVALPVEKHAKY